MVQQDYTLGAPRMSRYLLSTIHRYLDLPSTQLIQNQNSHRHNTNPPLQTLVQPPTHSPLTPHTPHQPKYRYMSNTFPVPTGLVKPKLNSLIHSPPIHICCPIKTHTHLTHHHQLFSPHARHSSITRQLR